MTWGIGFFKNLLGEIEERRLKCNDEGVSEVTTGSSGQGHNKNMVGVSTAYAAVTNGITWPNPVTDFEIVVPNTATLKWVLVVYDMPNAATAAGLLADIGSGGTDVAYDWILPNSRFFRRYTGVGFGRKLPGVLRLDFLPIGANTDIGVGAV